MKGWAVILLIVVLAVLWLRHRSQALAGQIGQGVKVPFNVFKPEFWNMKDDSSTFGTRGWWSNLWSDTPAPVTDSPYEGAAAPDVIGWNGDIPIVN